MTTKIITELTCNGCGKTLSFRGDKVPTPSPFVIEGFLFPEVPERWFRLEPNYKESRWTLMDFSLSGDFCSPECIISYIQKKIEERDNPKPLTATKMYTLVSYE